MKNFLLTLAVLIITLAAASCSDDDPVRTEPPNDVTAGDQRATEAFDDLQDVVASLSGMTPEQLRNVSFANVRNGFNDALTVDADNAIANLGLAILEILELNYDEDIWGLFDDLDEYLNGPSAEPVSPGNRHRTLFGKQFSLVVELPLSMTIMRGTTFPTTATIGSIQNLIKTKVLPALRRSLNHLTVVERHTNPVVRIQISDEGVSEWIKIDKGEIYLFDASVRALAAAFGLVIAYDMDFYGPDGTYGWVDDFLAIHEHVYEYGEPYDPYYYRYSYTRCPAREVSSGAAGDTLRAFRIYNYHVAVEDSLLLAIAYYNLTSRPGFMVLKDDVFGGVHQYLMMMIDKLEASADFIRNHRQNQSEESLIKLADLTDFDSDITNNLNDVNFARDFTKVEDMIDFFRDLLSGPYTFTEAIGSGEQDFTWQMDFSALFDNPARDLKAKLPYHMWTLPQQGPWVTMTSYSSTWGEPHDGSPITGFHWNGERCVEKTYNDIVYIIYYNEREYELPVEDYIQLATPTGQPLQPNEFLHLPDYTFNGFLPGWDRAKWLELKDRL
ncbi:MAG: hypothetical protein JSW50_05680 [Candidatus Latescibacterota bacterium]|nr:MAG: hypothetical protein JSW50_05680 [Candidatus Latescibacterota bacterium]